MQAVRDIDGYTGTGSALSLTANRLSYFFDIRGPSIAVDTACSSSLVAIHLACQSLEGLEASPIALVGGVNLLLSPAPTIYFSHAGAMAPDGRSKAFDAGANGFVRGEGAGIVVLKPLERAVSDGDRIYAVIRGSAVNQDGRSNGLTAPNRIAQQMVLREAYRRASVLPREVQYVETHGTGTLIGDPIEAAALGNVISDGRPAGHPCVIGSVKTNIGHLESAAGIAGFIKLVLMLEHRMIVPSLHFRNANPHIDFERLGLRVAQELMPWPKGPAIGGVSAFGFGGTNAHVVVSQAPENESLHTFAPAPLVLPLSARCPEAIPAVVRSWQQVLGQERAPLLDLCYTASLRRSHHDYRIAAVGDSAAELVEELGRCEVRRASMQERPRIAFVYSGQGGQWVGVGRELLSAEPAFAKAVEECEQAIQPHVDWSLREVLEGRNLRSRLDEIDVLQPVLFAIQVGLTAVWQHLGVEPEAVIGHSMGEVAAAYAAGVLSLEDAARVIAVRSRLLRRLQGRGAMLAVEMTTVDAARLIADCFGEVSVAASNGPSWTVLSGDDSALDELTKKLTERDIYWRKIEVPVAAHSAQVDEIGGELATALQGIVGQGGHTPLYSTVTGQRCPGKEMGSRYWIENLRQPVLFGGAVERAIENGYGIFVELGPHPVLTEAVEQTARYVGSRAVALHSLQRQCGELKAMRHAFARLHVEGYPVDWERLYSVSRRCIATPSYPWQRKRCWSPTIPEYDSDRDAAASSAFQAPFPDRFYELSWRQASRGKRYPPPPQGGFWLIFSGGGVGEAVAQRLRAEGELVTEVAAGLEFSHLLKPECKGIVHCWTLDAPSAESGHLAAMEAAERLGCVSVIQLVQELATIGWNGAGGLWLVTRGAQCVLAADKVNVEQSPLWGLAAVLAEEHREFDSRVVDLDPALSTYDSASSLWEEIGHADDEDRIAFRGSMRHVARLVRHREGERVALRLRKDASYLITGGLGNLGLRVAHWLAEQGARRLVLMGRSGLPARAEWSKQHSTDSTLAARVQAVCQLEAMGVSVHLAQVDVSDESQLSSFFENFAKENWPPIRGVVHTAGVVEDSSLAQLAGESLQAVMRPKSWAAWLLHRMERTPFDFFVMFSSLSSILGFPGLASYSAANAFLDALAHHRRTQGRSALSINWTFWEGQGFASLPHAKRLAEDLARRGIGPILPEEALSMLGHLLSGNSAQVVAVPINWPGFTEYYRGMRSPALTSEMTAPLAPHDLPFIEQLLALQSNAEQVARLEAYLLAEVSRVLRIPASQIDRDQPLANYGLDSIMAIELRNRLQAGVGLKLPSTLLWNHPTIAALRSYIAERLELTSSAATQPPDDAELRDFLRNADLSGKSAQE
jgi:acyl transferase domain-containing protein/acyl carrier protein